MEKIALLPGGFKPPHVGHYDMAKWLAADTGAKVLVRVGSKERDGITREMSLKLWELYTKNDSDIEVEASISNSPVKDVYDYIELQAPENSFVYLGMGEKDVNDKRYANIAKFAEPKGIKFKTKLVKPQGEGISASDMRGFIKNNDKKSFEKYIPNHVDKDQAWDIVTNIKEDLYNPEDKVNDYMRSSEFKAGYSKKDDVPPGYKYRRGGKYSGGGMGFGGMYESRGGESEMHIYDFDETIARAETPIPYEVKSPDGDVIEKGETTSVEFEKKKEYLENEYDEGVIIDYNFDAFKKPIIDATINNPVFQKLLNSIKNPNAKVTILTARSVGFPITQFLKDQGIWAYVVPLGLEINRAVTGQDKANWIEKRIKNTTKKVYFVDDADENREAVNMLSQKYPNIEFDIQDPPSMDEMLGMMTQAEKKKHAKNMKRLSKDMSNMKGNNYGGGGYKVPNYVKGTLTRKLYNEGQEDYVVVDKRNFRPLMINHRDGFYEKWSTEEKAQADADELNRAYQKTYGAVEGPHVVMYKSDYFNEKRKKEKKEALYPKYTPDQVQKVRYQASDTFTGSPKRAKKLGYKESIFTKDWWKQQINEVLSETKANTHLTHLEELILTQGQDGYNKAKSFLYELIKNLKGESNNIKNVSVKWDGAPAIWAGINPENGKFFVGTKSVFNKEPKINYTPQDISKNHGHAPGLASKLKLALQYLPALGIKGILQGDFMFDSDDVKTDEIDGVSHYTFRPNTIRYAVEANSELGKKILNAKIGIIWHSTYKNLSSEDSYSAGADISGLSESPNVWFDDAYFKDDTGILLNDKEEAFVLDKIKKADSINVNYENLPLKSLNTYINSEIRQNEFLSDPAKSFEKFKNWYQLAVDKSIEKVSKPETKERKRLAGEEKIKEFESQKQDIINIFKISKLLSEAKSIFITKYDKAVATKHFIDKGDGTLGVTKAEGFVAVDHTENGIKLVDRLEFSRNNFNAGKPGS